MGDLSTEPPQSIEQVYRDQRLALVRLAYLLTGSRDVAEDVVQAAFAAAQPRWDTIDGGLPDIPVADAYAQGLGCDTP